MPSDTIAKHLKKYGIGAKLRRLRLHTGLSPAMLSKLERDVMHPTLPTLLRIALVFSVGLDYFLTLEAKPVLEIVRKADRLRFPNSPEARRDTPDGAHEVAAGDAIYFDSTVPHRYRRNSAQKTTALVVTTG